MVLAEVVPGWYWSWNYTGSRPGCRAPLVGPGPGRDVHAGGGAPAPSGYGHSEEGVDSAALAPTTAGPVAGQHPEQVLARLGERHGGLRATIASLGNLERFIVFVMREADGSAPTRLPATSVGAPRKRLPQAKCQSQRSRCPGLRTVRHSPTTATAPHRPTSWSSRARSLQTAMDQVLPQSGRPIAHASVSRAPTDCRANSTAVRRRPQLITRHRWRKIRLSSRQIREACG